MNTLKSKNSMYLLAIFFILVIVLIYKVTPIFMQEKNSFLILYGILKLNTSSVNIVKIGERYYLSKSVVKSSPIKIMMESKGWKYKTQEGAAYIFMKDGGRLIITGRQFTKKYILWKFHSVNPDKKLR